MTGLLRRWHGGTSKFLSCPHPLTDAVSCYRQIFPDALKDKRHAKARSANPDPFSVRSRAKEARLYRANKRNLPADKENEEDEGEGENEDPEGDAEDED